MCHRVSFFVFLLRWLCVGDFLIFVFVVRGAVETRIFQRTVDGWIQELNSMKKTQRRVRERERGFERKS